MSNKNSYESMRDDAGSLIKALVLLLIISLVAIFIISAFFSLMGLVVAAIAVVSLPLYYAYVYIVHTMLMHNKSMKRSTELKYEIDRKNMFLDLEKKKARKLKAANEGLMSKGLVAASGKSISIEHSKHEIKRLENELLRLYEEQAIIFASDILILEKIKIDLIERHISKTDEKILIALECIDTMIRMTWIKLYGLSKSADSSKLYLSNLDEKSYIHSRPYEIFRASILLKSCKSVCSYNGALYIFYYSLYLTALFVVFSSVILLLIGIILLLVGLVDLGVNIILLTLFLWVMSFFSSNMEAMSQIRNQECTKEAEVIINEIKSRYARV